MGRTPEPLPPSRYSELLEAAEEKSNRHGFTVHALGHTGVANTEFSAMNRNWLYPKKQELHVPQNATAGSGQGNGRTIPLSQQSVKRFKEFFEEQEEVDITSHSVTARVKSVSECDFDVVGNASSMPCITHRAHPTLELADTGCSNVLCDYSLVRTRLASVPPAHPSVTASPRRVWRVHTAGVGRELFVFPCDILE